MKWADHCRFEELICGACLLDVDRLIDSGWRPVKPKLNPAERYARGLIYGAAINVDVPTVGSHDDVKLNFTAFLSVARRVYEAYGDRGLCVLALHIYLDKASSIINGVLRMLYDKYGGLPSRDEFLDKVYRHLGCEVSCLLVARFWDVIRRARTSQEVIDYVLKRHGVTLARETRRRKRAMLEAILSTITSLEDDEELIHRVGRVAENVYQNLKPHLRDIVCAATRREEVKRLLNCRITVRRNRRAR